MSLDHLWNPVSKLRLFVAKWRMLTQSKYLISTRFQTAGHHYLSMDRRASHKGKPSPACNALCRWNSQCPFPGSQRKRVAAESLRQPRRTPGGSGSVMCVAECLYVVNISNDTRNRCTPMKGVRCPLSVLCGGTNLILPFGSCVPAAWMYEGFSSERQLEAAPKDEPLGV